MFDFDFEYSIPFKQLTQLPFRLFYNYDVFLLWPIFRPQNYFHFLFFNLVSEKASSSETRLKSSPLLSFKQKTVLSLKHADHLKKSGDFYGHVKGLNSKFGNENNTSGENINLHSFLLSDSFSQNQPYNTRQIYSADVVSSLYCTAHSLFT